jgi:hypothetical protein
MPQKTGMFWTESWMGLSNRLVLAWEGQWLEWRDFVDTQLWQVKPNMVCNGQREMWTSCQWQSKKDEQLEKVGNPL